MTQVLTTNSVVANFSNVRLEFMGEQFELHKKQGEFWVEIQDLNEVNAARAANGPWPEPLRVRMGLVTGSHHMQVFWLPGGIGNVQIGFPFTWLINEHRWVPRNDAFIRPPETTPPKEVWNLTCIRCHTTGGQPRPDREHNTFDTRVAELGIACEACHGPAERHVQHQKLIGKSASGNNSRNRDTTIVQPRDLDHVRASQICGSCHSVKWFDEKEGWQQNGFRFRPGDDLEKTTPIVRPNKLEAQPWLQKVLAKKPDLFEDLFWSDGMIRVAGREFNGLIESPCFQRGDMSCLSCHSLHKSEPDDQLARGMDGNQACLQCHTKFSEKIAEHTHHLPQSSGSQCYNCHMPFTTYALLKSIRSHQITSPDVPSTLQTGRPVACNLCHLDQTLDWTATRLNTWYGKPKPNLNDDQKKIAASLLWLLRGDAGQRALAAWSMGWESARLASGQDWEAPHLSVLLDDPYSAVRYIAGRSLRELPGFTDFQYDFVSTDEDRRHKSTEAMNQWNKSASRLNSEKAGRVLLNPDSSVNAEAASRLLQQRNNRPVRLRE